MLPCQIENKNGGIIDESPPSPPPPLDVVKEFLKILKRPCCFSQPQHPVFDANALLVLECLIAEALACARGGRD